MAPNHHLWNQELNGYVCSKTGLQVAFQHPFVAAVLKAASPTPCQPPAFVQEAPRLRSQKHFFIKPTASLPSPQPRPCPRAGVVSHLLKAFHLCSPFLVIPSSILGEVAFSYHGGSLVEFCWDTKMVARWKVSPGDLMTGGSIQCQYGRLFKQE